MKMVNPLKYLQQPFAVMLGVHRALIQMYPDLVTIIVPRYPQDALEIAQVWFLNLGANFFHS